MQTAHREVQNAGRGYPASVRLDGSEIGSQESRVPMHPNAILHEIQQLYNVSDRLDSLAEQHPLVSEAHHHLGKRS